MRLGATIFLTDRSIGPVEVARALEERGFSSLWVPEHTHIPTSRRTPYPADPSGELPEQYKRTLDPFVALTAAAVATTTLRVGTGILLVAQRDPIVTAKALSSLDHVSGGRLTVGMGFGWNADEMEDHGVAYGERRAKAREHVLAMRRLWEDDEASFAGSHVTVPPTWSWPKPVQRPLPVLVGGGAGPTLFDHVEEYAQGWMPIGGRGLSEALPRLRERRADVQVVPFAVRPSEGKLAHYASLGIEEVVVDLPSAGADEVLPLLDRYSSFL